MRAARGVSPSSVNVAAFLRGSLFGALAAMEFKRLVACASVERHARARVLTQPGQPLQSLHLVVKGSVSVIAHGNDTREVLITVIGPGAWAAWLPCLVPQPLQTDYVAAPGTVCVALPAERVRECLAANPQLYPTVMADIDRRMRLLIEWTGQAALLDTEQRMARLISLLARDRKLGAANVVISITQQQLALLAGCSRQSVASLLERLASRGLIRTLYGRCEIPDLQALQHFAATPPLPRP